MICKAISHTFIWVTYTSTPFICSHMWSNLRLHQWRVVQTRFRGRKEYLELIKGLMMGNIVLLITISCIEKSCNDYEYHVMSIFGHSELIALHRFLTDIVQYRSSYFITNVQNKFPTLLTVNMYVWCFWFLQISYRSLKWRLRGVHVYLFVHGARGFIW